VQARHFVDCVTTGVTPRTDGVNGLSVVLAIEAAQMSLAEDREVRLEEIAPEAATGRAGPMSVPAPRRALRDLSVDAMSPAGMA